MDLADTATTTDTATANERGTAYQQVSRTRIVRGTGDAARVDEHLYFRYLSELPEQGGLFMHHLSTGMARRQKVAVTGHVARDFDWGERWSHPEAGTPVVVRQISSTGSTNVEDKRYGYAGLPPGAVQVDVDTIFDAGIREVARKMVGGTFTPEPPTPQERAEVVLSNELSDISRQVQAEADVEYERRVAARRVAHSAQRHVTASAC